MSTGPAPDDRFTISVDKDDHVITVVLQGILAGDSAGLIALWLTPLVLLEQRRKIELHIGLVTELNVEGVDTLTELAELAEHRGCDFRIIGGTPRQLAPLRLVGPARVLAELLKDIPHEP